MSLENDDERRADSDFVCDDNDLVDMVDVVDDVHVHHSLQGCVWTNAFSC